MECTAGRALRLLIFTGVIAAAGCVSPPPSPTAVFQIEAPGAPSPLHFSLSPDGHDLVAWSASGNGIALWSRPLDSLLGQVVPGTERARGGASGFPFWSPDSAFIGSFGDRSLQVIDRKGGSLRTLAPAPFAQGGTWSKQGIIVYSPDENGPLYRIAAEGGMQRQLTTLNPSRQEVAHRHPYFLPDGRHFLYVSVTANAENSGIWIGSLGTEEPRFLVSSTVKAVFAPPDTILYVQGTTLMARQFDLRRLDFSGPPHAVVDNLAVNERNSAAGFTVSANGVLAYLKGRTGGQIGSIPIVVAVNWRSLRP